jgi:hypothetical protein
MDATPAHDRATSPDPKLIIPGDPDRIAVETARLSPENLPADPKSGPKALRLQILALWFLVLILAVCLGIWINVFAGVAALAIGTVGLMFNPVVGAAEQRAEEREVIARRHAERDPDEVVVRTTSKREERRMGRTI